MEGTTSDYHMLGAALGHASGRQLRGLDLDGSRDVDTWRMVLPVEVTTR